MYALGSYYEVNDLELLDKRNRLSVGYKFLTKRGIVSTNNVDVIEQTGTLPTQGMGRAV